MPKTNPSVIFLICFLTSLAEACDPRGRSQSQRRRNLQSQKSTSATLKPTSDPNNVCAQAMHALLLTFFLATLNFLEKSEICCNLIGSSNSTASSKNSCSLDAILSEDLNRSSSILSVKAAHFLSNMSLFLEICKTKHSKCLLKFNFNSKCN